MSVAVIVAFALYVVSAVSIFLYMRDREHRLTYQLEACAWKIGVLEERVAEREVELRRREYDVHLLEHDYDALYHTHTELVLATQTE